MGVPGFLQLSVSGIVALTGYFIILCIYRLTLHPLAKYPGPFLSKISPFSIYLQTLTGDRHLVSLAEHRKYGPVVRIAPNTLSFSDPSALRSIYQSARGSNPLRKAPWYETVDAPSGAYSTHTEISRNKHAFRRRILDGAFSDASVRVAESTVIGVIETLRSVLGTDENDGVKWSPARNMSEMSTYFAYDVMGELVFGRRFDCLTSTEHRYVPKLLMASSAFVYSAAYLPMQWLVRLLISSPALMNWFGGQLARDGHAYVEYASACVDERIAAQSSKPETDFGNSATGEETDDKGHKDVMHYLLSARHPVTQAPLTRKELDAESSLLIAAGADTTSTTLAAVFFYLTLPSSFLHLEGLTKELRSSYSSLSSITSPSITANALLRATIDEALRLCPSVPTHLPRTIITGGINISGQYIPAGTTVGCPAYVVHRDTNAYPDPHIFLPQRWIADPIAYEGELQHPEQVSRAKEAFCAFSLGSRGCVGRGLAYLELCIVVGRLLWEFDIRRAEGTEHVTVRIEGSESERRREKEDKWMVNSSEFQLRDCFLAERDGPMVEFRKWRK